MAALRLRLYEAPEAEIETLSNPPPRWVERLLESYGASGSQPTAAGQVEALGEELGRRLRQAALVVRRAEQRGWSVTLAGPDIVIATGLAPAAARAALEEDGTWHLVQQLAADRQRTFI
ncbi:MAG: hypothetical protein M3072_15455 [Candidatus Dormibacteraeota bacterium]|nr:hypothetical protein [Candidatus Dormibacteraeota bacterium]